MDNKYLRNVYFLKTFKPTSTSFCEFSNPGLSNVRIYSMFVPQILSSNQTTIKKQSEPKEKDKVQTGSGDDLEEIFKKPIKVKRTVLSQHLEEEPSEPSPSSSNKRKQESQSLPKKVTKKTKFSFNVTD